MLTCFKCMKIISDPVELFSHVKVDHKICGDNCMVQCTLCWKTFTNFSTFKRNVSKCFDAMLNEDDDDAIPDPRLYKYAVDEEILNYEEKLNKANIELVCCLSAKMNWARKDVFDAIAMFKQIYVTTLISGIEETIIRYVPTEKEENAHKFIEAIHSSYENVASEERFYSELKKMDLISDLTVCEMFKRKPPPKKRRQKKQTKPNEEAYDVDARQRKIPKKRIERIHDSDESEDDEDDSDGTNETEDREVLQNIEVADTQQEESDIEISLSDIEIVEKGKVTLLPIEFQIKKFFELPNVFEKIKLNTAKIEQGPKLDHFIKGRLWREKLKNYKSDQLVIPFHFYGDGFQINNPLGPHAKSGELHASYYCFPTIPSEYVSRLDNIFVAQLHPAKYHKDYSNEQIYNNIVDTFIGLAEAGISLNINGEMVNVFFVCGLIIGDNKEQNQKTGYVESFTGNHCCRYCKMHINEIRSESSTLHATRRNRQNYDSDVAVDNQAATGIKEYSIFNRIPFFHVTESTAADLAHDVTEGFLHRILTMSIRHFIAEKYFTLSYLNERMKTMDFGETENGNRPSNISSAHLKSEKLRMTASEMFFFAHHFTFMIGSRVPDHDPVWQFVLQTIKFFDLCYSHEYGQDDIDRLLTDSDNLNQRLMALFNVNLKHKSHLCTHYHELTQDFGPLRYVQTIRFEGKHKELKSYAKNTNSRINIALSVAKKTQYKFAHRLLQHEGLEDRICVPKDTIGLIEDKSYYSRIISSAHLNEILQIPCHFATKIVLNGVTFSMELWLPNFLDEGNKKIHEVVDIVILDLKNITKMFVVCKTYAVTYDDHYNCYVVKMESLENEMSIINVSEYLSQHHYPVKIHNIQNNFMFRTKRF